MDILYDKNGTPLVMNATKAFLETTGKPSDYEERKKKILAPYSISKTETIPYKKYQVMNWGKDNNFPTLAAEQISTTSVLNTGLRFLRTLTIGQGIFACRVKGYDDKGNEMLEPISNPEVNRFVNSRMVRRCLEKTSRDYFKFGNAAVELMTNENNDLIGLNPLNALFYRYTVPSEWGSCKCIVSGAWPDVPGEKDKVTVMDCLMDYDPDLEYEVGRLKGKDKKNPIVYPIRDSWSNNDYYGEPIWLPAYILGWVEIAHMVPQFLKKAYKNQITWKWHVQIPYSYWEKRFPMTDFKTNMERQKAIQKYMDEIENNLCGVENAEKPLFTNYAVNEANGKIEEEWKITALDNKYKGGENLVTSAAANSEILFSLMVNPNVFGAGMPGGTYAGNQGGSNIREAFLVNIANAWIDRQNLLDPIELYLRNNGVKDVELRFRNTILTTLDKGAGTQKTLS